MTEPLVKEQFEGHVGDLFRIQLAESAVVDVTLTEVTGMGPKTTQQAIDAGRRAPFALLFCGPAEPLLPQSIYRLSHETMGVLDMFLVPIGPDGDGMGYEAVFN